MNNYFVLHEYSNQINTISIFSVGVKLEGENQFLIPTEKIETVY